MTKAVLTTKVHPEYDDLPEERYHFPKTYLNQVNQAVGDLAIYYEPRRPSGDLSSSGGRQSYFAVARIDRVVEDLKTKDHFYAEISGYLEFTRPVPFKEHSQYYESILKKPDGTTSKGAFGRSVREIPDREFELILSAGFGHILGKEQRQRPLPDAPEEPMPSLAGFAEPKVGWPTDIPLEQDRKIVEQLVSRPFRDRAFSAAVKDACGDTCAMSGIKLINGGGRSEAQAAHIRPVAQGGPDSVRNGIALSGTMHWMFDRGLVSIRDDYKLLFARSQPPESVERLLGGNRRLLVPERKDLHPHKQFLEFHRREVFKG